MIKILLPTNCILVIFFSDSADSIWKGVTSVSNQGRMKGRASRVRRKIDFNRGQIIGRGNAVCALKVKFCF